MGTCFENTANGRNPKVYFRIRTQYSLSLFLSQSLSLPISLPFSLYFSLALSFALNVFLSFTFKGYTKQISFVRLCCMNEGFVFCNLLNICTFKSSFFRLSVVRFGAIDFDNPTFWRLTVLRSWNVLQHINILKFLIKQSNFYKLNWIITLNGLSMIILLTWSLNAQCRFFQAIKDLLNIHREMLLLIQKRRSYFQFMKPRRKDEIHIWGQFHHHLTGSLCAC